MHRAVAISMTSVIALMGLSSAPAFARQDAVPDIHAEMPSDFESLNRNQTVMVDVVINDQQVGQVNIQVVSGFVRVLDPEKLLELLPALTNRQAVLNALSGDIPSHAELVCTPNVDPQSCGKLDVAVAGVIFDRDHFLLRVIVNSQLIANEAKDQPEYLSAPQKALSLINSVSASVAGNLNSGTSDYSLSDRLLIASGNHRLRADISYAREGGVQADQVAVEWDRPERRYSAGALWTPGSYLMDQRKILGAGLQSQIDTRRDRDAVTGNPIVVFLAQRARVDIVRDGRTLSSNVYSSGNQTIDTAELPDGSYDITLQIYEAGEAPRSERRFFSKNAIIPSLGRTNYSVFAGVPVATKVSGFLPLNTGAFFQARAITRAAKSLALDYGLQLADKRLLGEAGIRFISVLGDVRLGALVGTDGAYGAIAQIQSGSNGPFSLNVDLRRIDVEEESVWKPSSFGEPVGPYTQGSGVLSYSFRMFRLFAAWNYRKSDGANVNYSIGPSIEYDLFAHEGVQLTAKLDVTATDRGNAAVVGLTARLLGNRSYHSGTVGVRRGLDKVASYDEGPFTSLSSSWSPDVPDSNLSLGVAYDHLPGQDIGSLRSDFQDRYVRLSGDVLRTERNGFSATEYRATAQSTFVSSRKRTQLSSDTANQSVILVMIVGAGPNDTFEVIVDNRTVGSTVGAKPFALSLPTYREYEIRVKATSASLLSYDSSIRNVGLYPGTVTNLTWNAYPIMVKIGRLMTPGGVPVREASITGPNVWSETDHEGRFQVEVADGAELRVTTSSGDSYPLTLPNAGGSGISPVARVGDVICCQLSSAGLRR